MAVKRAAKPKVEQYVWLVQTGNGILAFGHEAGAREAADIANDRYGQLRGHKPVKVRFFYDSATTADVEDLLGLPDPAPELF